MPQSKAGLKTTKDNKISGGKAENGKAANKSAAAGGKKSKDCKNKAMFEIRADKTTAIEVCSIHFKPQMAKLAAKNPALIPLKKIGGSCQYKE